MKSFFISLVAVILTVCISCKKSNLESTPPANPPETKKWVVRTIAGGGAASFTNGPALSATFHFPEDVAVAEDGIIYVTDVFNHCIRKIAAGQVSTLAGGGGSGIVNGNALSARFIFPYSITIGAGGSLYSTDENDPRIRKISSGAEVTTHAGTGEPGFADGNADTSRFRGGNTLAADTLGNLYVSDGSNNRIRKISVSGQVSTIAGNGISGFHEGNGATAQFSAPAGITIDKEGNLYVVDRGNFRIRKITPGGDVSTIAGSGLQGTKDGPAGEAEFSQDMRDIIIDAGGNLYLSDWDRIRKISPQGIVSTIAGSTAGFADGDGPAAKFDYPNGLAVDATGNIYVADLNNNRIRKITLE